MTTEELYGLAQVLEGEDLLGEGDEPIGADAIFAVLEALDEHGVDLAVAMPGVS